MSFDVARGFRRFIILFGLAAPLFCFAQSPAPVTTDSVELLDLQAKMGFTGMVHSRTTTLVTAGVDAMLEWVIEPGSRVNENDILVKMDTLPLQLQLAEQKAVAKRAEINARYLKNEWERLEVLSKSNSTSEFQLDQLRAQYELAVAERDISLVKQQQIENQIARATVKAAYSGLVVEPNSRAGTDVSRGDTLLKVIDTENLEVRVHIPIKYLKYVNIDEQIEFGTDNKATEGRIAAKIPSADPISQTFEMRIVVPTSDQQWLAGELVRVDVPIEKKKPGLAVHRDALVLRNGDAYVMKVDTNHIARKIPVSIGSGGRTRVSVAGDLTEGDKVAIRGAEQLSDGQEVIVQQKHQYVRSSD
jgi:RND family efflux transporter MFP subunit